MVDEKDITAFNSKGEKIFIKNQSAYYKAALRNVMEDDEHNKFDEIGYMGDLNGAVGSQWLALYYAKNEAAEPILANSLKVVEFDDTIPAGYTTGIHMFGSAAAENLNNPLYVFNYTARSIFVYEHIPGMDKLGRSIEHELAPKQLGSVAAQLGKKQTLTETFGCVGWDATPKELKHIAEFQYMHGVNLMCQHLLPFTEHGQRKRDYPEHFSAVNPWANKDFKTFNDYFSILGKTLSESTEMVNVAVLHPIRSAYLYYKREETGFGIGDFDRAFAEFIEMLGVKQIPHHYIDETILVKHGKVEDKTFVCGKCRYEYLIIPDIYTMDISTEKLIKEYVLNGGKILSCNKRDNRREKVYGGILKGRGRV